MNKTITILISVILCLEVIETRPRYGFRYWKKFVGSSSEESSEDDSFESCVGCSQTNIGNGYKNRNRIHYNSKPNFRQGPTETYEEIEEQNGVESQSVTRNGYRGTERQSYNNFNGYESQGGEGTYNNQRSVRPNANSNGQRRPNNRFETSNKRHRSSEIGDFGNGHDNRNTFNINKKNIYID